MAQEMCDEAVNKFFFVFDSIPNQYKTHEMWNGVLSEDPFLIVLINKKHKECVMKLLIVL